MTKQSKNQKNIQEITKEVNRMKRELAKAKGEGYRIIYIDETCFTRTTVPKAEWCLRKQNATFDQADLDEPTLALLSGISKEKGQETFMIFEKSVNIVKFKQYLT